MNRPHDAQEPREPHEDIWLNWEWLWRGVFYGSLVLSVGFMLADDDLGVPIGVAILLTVILTLWHILGMRWAYRHLQNWESDTLPRFIVIMVDIMLWFVLVNFSLAYYFVLFGLFIQVFRHLPRRLATIASIFLTGALIFEQLTDAGEPFSLDNPSLWLFLFIGLAAIFMGIWISAIIEQSAERRLLIEQLETTQADLAAAERREGILQGTLEERQRLTREIHDTLAQGFTSIIMHLEAAEQALPHDTEILQKHMARAQASARNSLKAARRVINELRPDLLEKGSLMEAIERTAKQWQAQTGINANVTSTGEPLPLHSTIEITLLRAVQEALNNIWKHAQANVVQVTVSYMGDLIMLDIQDDGVGLGADTTSSLRGGFGLQAMRERVEQCGGTVALESDLGEGTTVVIAIPLTSPPTSSTA
jgi:signal transduction histidine kinase